GLNVTVSQERYGEAIAWGFRVTTSNLIRLWFLSTASSLLAGFGVIIRDEGGLSTDAACLPACPLGRGLYA
ncbi:MAG: hypothetical protein M0036_18760, partial [Desulfobacteraceae bacterium]|nr:hypothetical protein [Desulfobacteraceae bacterium]